MRKRLLSLICMPEDVREDYAAYLDGQPEEGWVAYQEWLERSLCRARFFLALVGLFMAALLALLIGALL